MWAPRGGGGEEEGQGVGWPASSLGIGHAYLTHSYLLKDEVLSPNMYTL